LELKRLPVLSVKSIQTFRLLGTISSIDISPSPFPSRLSRHPASYNLTSFSFEAKLSLILFINQQEKPSNQGDSIHHLLSTIYYSLLTITAQRSPAAHHPPHCPH
jgi:hypothetical protein